MDLYEYTNYSNLDSPSPHCLSHPIFPQLTTLKAEMKEKEIEAYQKQLRLTNSLGCV